MKLSSERAKTHQAPDFSFKESDLLTMKQTVQQLVSANNNLHTLLKDYAAEKQRLTQTFYMSQVILKLIVDKGLATTEEIDKLTHELQSQESGWVDKAEGEVAEIGDVIIISFCIYAQDGTVVDDRSKEALAYSLGSNELPCDDRLVGISKRESRHLSVTFSEGFKHKEYIGQELSMHLTCHAIKRRRQ
jgi:hypothetical protein